MHSNIFNITKPLGQSVTTDGPVARRIDQAKFDLTGPRRHTILPEIWSEPVHPGGKLSNKHKRVKIQQLTRLDQEDAANDRLCRLTAAQQEAVSIGASI